VESYGQRRLYGADPSRRHCAGRSPIERMDLWKTRIACCSGCMCRSSACPIFCCSRPASLA